MQREGAAAGEEPWAPFKSEDEWELARWLTKSVGQEKADEFSKLKIVQDRVKPSWHNKYTLNKSLDRLPAGPGWRCEMVQVPGDLRDKNGMQCKEDVELWMRAPWEPGLPRKHGICAEHVYADAAGAERVLDELWTADWWWKTQGLMPPGATIAPVILSSDQTHLSVHSGDKKAWPVYLTLGNISADIRRQPSKHATILIGYLPVCKMDTFSPERRAVARHRLFHYCMERLLAPLVEAGQHGVNTTCADGFIRRVFPILAAFVADFPEQCLVSCCRRNTCPGCPVEPKRAGEPLHTEFRDAQATLESIREHMDGKPSPAFDSDNLHEHLFLHHADLLHQLHKGVFKDHLVSWCVEIMGYEEVDTRFKSMPSFPGLRHFKNGISLVSQWTGKERQEMERTFIGALSGAVAKALLDFIFLSRLSTHTTSTISALQASLDRYHLQKQVVIDLGIRKHFNVPKLHSMVHYPAFILSHGSATGYNTESPERLHIDYAKKAYRASNKRDYVAQMACWLSRQEAIDLKTAYIRWRSPADAPGDQPGQQAGEENNHGPMALPPHARLPPRTLQTAAQSPFPRTTVRDLVHKHGAVDFVPALRAFLDNLAHARTGNGPLEDGLFDVYKQLTFTQKSTRFTDGRDYAFHVHAVRGQPAEGLRKANPGIFDTVLLIDPVSDTGLRHVRGMDGCLRPGRVRALFMLPPELGECPLPLAYIELFTPLRARDLDSGMLQVARSSRNRRRRAVVVRVDDIFLPCHLVPKSTSANWSSSWDETNVLDHAPYFLLNTYIDAHSFLLFSGFGT
ncbi:hypothetical protein BC834DRAFT_926511 [Gloeopeniophorella convolvens]|nr:hypothetical protein BC834DRAFT_926511 [Gloeopeniophorella convolvens]